MRRLLTGRMQNDGRQTARALISSLVCSSAFWPSRPHGRLELKPTSAKDEASKE